MAISLLLLGFNCVTFIEDFGSVTFLTFFFGTIFFGGATFVMTFFPAKGFFYDGFKGFVATFFTGFLAAFFG